MKIFWWTSQCFLVLAVTYEITLPYNCLAEQPGKSGIVYEATVPDTLDLAERARLAINGLTRTLDEEHNFEQYFLVRYTADPPYLMHMCIGDLGCTPKYAESLPMMRVMSGSHQNLDVEKRLMDALCSLLDEQDGLYYVPAVDLKKTPWRVRGDYEVAHEDMAAVFGNARMMLAMQAWYQRDGDKKWLDRMAKMAKGLDKIAIHKDDYAFYPEGKVGMEFARLRNSGYKYAEEPKSESEGAEGTVLGYQGGQIRALCHWYRMSGDKEALKLAEKLVNFVPRINSGAMRREKIPGFMDLTMPISPGTFMGITLLCEGYLNMPRSPIVTG